jgi:hypothetical protein
MIRSIRESLNSFYLWYMNPEENSVSAAARRCFHNHVLNFLLCLSFYPLSSIHIVVQPLDRPLHPSLRCASARCIVTSSSRPVLSICICSLVPLPCFAHLLCIRQYAHPSRVSVSCLVLCLRIYLGSHCIINFLCVTPYYFMPIKLVSQKRRIIRRSQAEGEASNGDPNYYFSAFIFRTHLTSGWKKPTRDVGERDNRARRARILY